jgi:hypothetical protein
MAFLGMLCMNGCVMELFAWFESVTSIYPLSRMMRKQVRPPTRINVESSNTLPALLAFFDKRNILISKERETIDKRRC